MSEPGACHATLFPAPPSTRDQAKLGDRGELQVGWGKQNCQRERKSMVKIQEALREALHVPTGSYAVSKLS